MTPSVEILSKLNDYFRRRITLRELEAWLVPRLPVFLDAPDSVAGRLASAIELSLAELYAGLRSERSVRMALSRYRSNQQIVWFEYPGTLPETLSSSSTCETISAATPLTPLSPLSQIRFWNTGPAKASA